MTATQTDRPDQAVAEALDFIHSCVGLLIDTWPALGQEELVLTSTGALATIIAALHRGDRAGALAAAETTRAAVLATHHVLIDPPFSLEPGGY